MEGFKIKIVGSGSKEEIIAALRNLATDLNETDFFDVKNEIELEGSVLLTKLDVSENIEEDTY